jgi:hypothetical protein
VPAAERFGIAVHRVREQLDDLWRPAQREKRRRRDVWLDGPRFEVDTVVYTVDNTNLVRRIDDSAANLAASNGGMVPSPFFAEGGRRNEADE